MTVAAFCEKYGITAEIKAGFVEQTRYWARHNFAEKLLIQIYIRTFGIYPGEM